MSYQVTNNKKDSREQLARLIQAFHKDLHDYRDSKYSEAQLRVDYLNPFLKSFGWDVDNESNKSQFLRDVIQEESIDVEEEEKVTKKNPDYTLRFQGTRKLFVEAKKVSIELNKTNKPAFQTRRYGWNANLGISVLTNFEWVIVYDCRHKPNLIEDVTVARYRLFHYTEFLDHFDELYDLLSFESVASGFIDEVFSLTQPDVTTFDDYFLSQIETWRKQLAEDVIRNNTGLNNEDINFLIQRLLNRIVFLRICEDRDIEKANTLQRITNYEELKELFKHSDEKYNSGLFDFIEDNFSLNINLSSEVLVNIFKDLYYPLSPYDFSVVDPTILSQIYERYLGSKISILEGTKIQIIEEPEVTASSGVIPTPKLIVEKIIDEVLTPLFAAKPIGEIQELRIADICCGSGTFLISAFEYFLEKITLQLVSSGVNDEKIIHHLSHNSYQLTLYGKQQIFINNIFGVDINPYAVEVTKFSLFLKLLEGENEDSIEDYLRRHKQKVLPTLDGNIKCGNSLVDENYFNFQPEAINDNNLLFKLKPFNWIKEFEFLEKSKGFDAIVGNPPYVRIQNIVKFSGEEIKYYRDNVSGYVVAEADTFDKYYLFIQRAIALLKENGILGYIVPHKFFIARGGKALRRFIISNSSLYKIIHFGTTQVFPNRSTYTAILLLEKREREEFYFKRLKNLIPGLTSTINYDTYPSTSYTDQPWIFVSSQTKTVFEKIKQSNTIPLNEIAEIAVGLQTSADDIYIFAPISETETTYRFKKGNSEFEVEKAITRPCLYDSSFGLFDTVEPNSRIIFPYTIESDKAQVFSEDYFQQQFPLAWSYLSTQIEKLSKRSINGGKNPKWYQFGRSQSLTRFINSPKLIWSVLSTKPGYIYDENDLQFTGGGNGPYYSLLSKSDYSIHYLLGILAHPVFEAMVKSGASEFRGDYYSHGKQFIENLPIKVIDFDKEDEKKMHDDIVKTVQNLIETKNAFNKEYIRSKRDTLGRKMDILYDTLINQVNTFYGITADEMNTVLKDEMFVGELNNE